MGQFFMRFRNPSWKPSRIFLLVLCMVFVVECAIMFSLWAAPAQFHGGWAEALVDSVTLTAALAPALWLTLVRPLQRLSASRGQLLRQLFEAQEQERSRLARDLHDELGQHLTTIMIGLRTIEQAEDLVQARERARAVAAAGTAGLSEVRRIARALRPIVLEDLGIAPAVERLCDEFRSVHNMPVELSLEIDPGRRFDSQIELCVFRVIQESLTNAAKYARAQHVRVGLEGGAWGLRLTVSDDGRGFKIDETTGSSFGLNGMRERVELLDGRFAVESHAGAGTTIRAVLPAGGRSEAEHP